MKTLVLANQKGGVGKSAVATLLAHHLAQKGLRVLAIDFDHQGNFTSPMLLSKRPRDAGITSERLLNEPGARVPAKGFVMVPASDRLIFLEKEAAMHTPFARNFRAFVERVDADFDVCIVDTNPNPDIRMISALVSADFVLSPIQLNQEAVDGVRALLTHSRVGVYKIKALLNPKLELIGLLPTMVETTPFQRANFRQLIERYLSLMIRIGDGPGDLASIPKRSAIAEAQASGEVLWEMKKTAARDAWKEVEPSIVDRDLGRSSSCRCGLRVWRCPSCPVRRPDSRCRCRSKRSTRIRNSRARSSIRCRCRNWPTPSRRAAFDNRFRFVPIRQRRNAGCSTSARVAYARRGWPTGHDSGIRR
jgi:chromosome partitioning protein